MPTFATPIYGERLVGKKEIVPKVSTPPTPDAIAQRGELRGLGEELMRMDDDNQRTRTPASELCGRVVPFICSWFACKRLIWLFLQTAEPDLFSIMAPFNDTTILQAHGEEFLELLINKAPDAEWMEWLFTSLLVAARADNIDVFHRVFALCKNSQEFWAVERRIEHLLNYTVCGGSADVLSALLEAHFFLSAAQKVTQVNRWCAMVSSAKNGHRGCVRVLINAGVPLEYKGTGGTALTVAVENGHEGVVLELLAAGVENINDQGVNIRPKFKSNPLCIAASKNNTSMMGILLAAGAAFGNNRTDTLPIILAAKVGHCGPLKLLLSAGADANVVNSRGESALHMACFYSHEGAVELLLGHNASLTSRSDDGLSPYDVVAMEALSVHENPFGVRHPSTLNVAETAAADRIYGMLRRTSAWRRRGWLVMMRARHLVTVQVLDDSPLEEPSPAEHEEVGHDEETTMRNSSCTCLAFQGLTLAGDHVKNAVSTNALLSGGGHDSGKQSGHGAGWEVTIEWLVRCPDERGVFREILGFL